MDKRPKIGLLFSYDPKWIAGTYYVMNIISASKLLKEKEQPIFTIISSKQDFLQLQSTISYSYLQHFEPTLTHTVGFCKRITNKLVRVLFKKNLFQLRHYYNILTYNQVNIIFPVNYKLVSLTKHLDSRITLLYWIPDFQDKYLPHYFSQADIDSRNEFYEYVSSTNNNVVFSSNTACKDFVTWYPNSKTNNYVFQFSVTHPNISHLSKQAIFEKYGLPEKYFFCPNQFWQHKNHIVVLQAIHQLLLQNVQIQVVFSGKEYDSRNENYFTELQLYIQEQDIQNNVIFLGFIPREDQLYILKHAITVIQPSLFEGWSTVVEDCKAQNQYIVLSDIPIHREQIIENATFFNPHNPFDLANNLKLFWNSTPIKKELHYENDRKKSIETFINICKQIN